jgi:hypothetical protein
MPYQPFPCPKCSQLLEASGEVDFEGQTYPVYQCDACRVPRELFGVVSEMPVTFYVKDGVARHPADDPPGAD